MVDGPAVTSSSAASALEPTGWPVAATPSITLASRSSWRGVSTPAILREGQFGLAPAHQPGVALPGLRVDHGDRIVDLAHRGRHDDFLLGNAHAAELDGEPLEAVR